MKTPPPTAPNRLARGPNPEFSGPPATMIERIAAARGGDEQALEDVIRYYQNRIAGYVAALMGGDGADLDDLCQIVFLKMALALPRLRSIEVFEPWLFKIARNVCTDHHRRHRWRKLVVPLSREHERIAEPQRKEPREVGRLERAVQSLSGAQRELIALLREREYSYEELARLTGSNARAVAGRLFRARARLRKLLCCDGTEP
jgi:RNA polymerase sigma-70 factor (ECF subfamily)